MKIYVGEKLLNFSDQQLSKMFLDEGKEGRVYRYGDDVLKIYHEKRIKQRLDEENSIRFSQIPTKRILLPEKMIYAEDKTTFIGYTTPYIDKKDPRTVIDVNMGKFLEELDIINEDLIMLANNNAYILDFHIKNFLYDGKFYMGDPGSHTFTNDATFKELYNHNTYYLSLFIISLISQSMSIWGEDFKVFSRSFDHWEYIGDQMRKNVKKKETVKQYVKRMVGANKANY